MSSLTPQQLGVVSDRRTPPCPVLTSKRKKPSGYGFLPNDPPNRFYIVEPMEDASGRRPEHPAYEWFNRCKDPRIVSKIPCSLGGARREDVAELSRVFYRWDAKNWGRAPKGYLAPPHHRGSFCTTQSAEQDGERVKARRWNGTEYAEMDCPGDRCEFATPARPGCRPPCLKSGRIWLHPEWGALAAMVEADDPDAAVALRHLPNSPLRLSTAGQFAPSLKSLDGFLSFVERQLQGLEVWPTPLHGLPFWLSVHLRSGDTVDTPKGPAKRKYTVYEFEMAGDISSWLVRQAEWRNKLKAGTVALLGPGAPEEERPETFTEDIRQITEVVATRPAKVAAVDTDPEPTPEKRDLLAEIKQARTVHGVKIRDWWDTWQKDGKEPDPAKMDDAGREELLAWIVAEGQRKIGDTAIKELTAIGATVKELEHFLGRSSVEMTAQELLDAVRDLVAAREDV